MGQNSSAELNTLAVKVHPPEVDEEMISDFGLLALEERHFMVAQEAQESCGFTPKSTIDDVPAVSNHQLLFIGGCHVGKSTVINALLNSGVDRQSLQTPAVPANPQVSNGQTDRICAYVTGAGNVLIDTIGLTDPRFTRDQIISNLYEIVYNFRIGISRVVVTVKHDVFTEQEQKLIRFYNVWFGKWWHKNAVVVITNFDQEPITTEEYLALDHSPAYKTFLELFDAKNVVLGSFAQDQRKYIDVHYESRRKAFKVAILNALHANPPASKLYLQGRDLFEKLRGLFSFVFRRSLKQPEKRRLQDALQNGELQHQLYCCQVLCTVCLQVVQGPHDGMIVTSCSHVFHFDCLREWVARAKTCPNCRETIHTSVVYPAIVDDGIHVQGPFKTEF
eukprot:m.7159 g.7159  ORF g.7159 m.7159 type:complete len:391 (+) comp5222_c0_seq2:15-1187(+)